MNEIRMIKNEFYYLELLDFKVFEKKTNLYYEVRYNKKSYSIIIDYDLRTHAFEVNIYNDSLCETKSLLSLISELDATEFNNLIENVYHKAEDDWTFSRNHFLEIVHNYAKLLIKQHRLLEIITTETIPDP